MADNNVEIMELPEDNRSVEVIEPPTQDTNVEVLGTEDQVAPPQDFTTIDSTDLIDTPESQAAIDTAKATKDIGLQAAMERQRLGTANETDLANIDFAINQGLIERPADKIAADRATELAKIQAEKEADIPPLKKVEEKPQTLIEKIRGAREAVGTIEEVTERLAEETGLAGAREAATIAAQAVNEATIDIQKFIATSQDEIEDVEKIPALLSRMRAAQANLSEEKNRELRGMKLDLLLAQQNSLIATGALTDAEQFVKVTAEDIFADLNDEIDALKFEGLLNEKEAAEAKDQAVFDRDLALQGFVKISDPAGLEGLTEDEIQRVPNIVTGGIDIYKKPEEEVTGPTISEQLKAEAAGFSIVDGKIVPQTNIDKGVVGGFDIGVYATDPNHERAVAQHLSNIGTLETSEDIDEYVQRVAPNSPVTSDMIRNTSEKFGVPWEMLVAMMQQDSSLGTKGKGARTFNPGNVGNDDAGNIVNYGDWQTGVDAVGAWLNNHRATVELTPELKLKAANLSVKLFKSRRGLEPENLKLVTDRLKQGLTIDEIEDELRLSSESLAFTGPIRDASESIGFTMTPEKRENLFNTIDRSIEENDADRAKEVIMKAAIDSYPVAEGKTIRGTKRTLEFLEEIETDLIKYEKAGGKTGIFEGNLEKVADKAGQVKDPELRTLATKIAAAIQKYRRSMSGVAFSVPESREYKALFPSIDKSKEFNSAVLDGLKEVMSDDFDFYMVDRMGEVAYNELFGNIQAEDGLNDDEAWEAYKEETK